MKYIILALSVIMTASTSIYLFRNTEEIHNEYKTTNWSEMRKNKYLPYYLSSLYLGPVRGMLTNTLWLKYDNAREKRMYYECKEVVEILLLLQPRNEIIWQFLSREMSFNIPAIIPKRRRWEWIKNGFLKLYEGILALPHSVLLKYQMMEDLYKKSFPTPGRFDEYFIENFINNNELQDKICPSSPCSPFNAAVGWGRAAYDQIISSGKKMVYTDTGLIIHASTILNFIRDIYFVEGYWNWFSGNYNDALNALEQSLEEVGSFKLKYPQYVTLFHDRFTKAITELLNLVKHESVMKKADIYERRRYLQKYPGMDERLLYLFLSRKIINDYNDYYEFNDDAIYARMLPPSKVIKSMLIDGADVDNYLVPSNILKYKRHVVLKIKHSSENKVKLQLYHLLDQHNEVVLWEKLVEEGEHEFTVSFSDVPYLLIRLSTDSKINAPLEYFLMYYF